MIAIPALDLRGGACVQLAAGSYDEEVIRIPDPVGVAIAWRQYGFRHLHVVDLDGAARRGNNAPQIHAILGATDVEVQVGGGIRDRESIRQSLSDGAQRVVIGTQALEDPDWLIEMSVDFPGSIVVAADVRDRRILSHGWTRTHQKLVLDLVEELNGRTHCTFIFATHDPALMARAQRCVRMHDGAIVTEPLLEARAS